VSFSSALFYAFTAFMLLPFYRFTAFAVYSFLDFRIPFSRMEFIIYFYIYYRLPGASALVYGQQAGLWEVNLPYVKDFPASVAPALFYSFTLLRFSLFMNSR